MLRQAHRKFLSGVSLFSTFALVAFEANAGWCSVDQLGNQKYCYYDRGACESQAHPMGWRCFPDGGQSNQNNQNNDAYNAGRALGLLLFGDPNKKSKEAIEQQQLQLERERLALERERLALQQERKSNVAPGYYGESKDGVPHGQGTMIFSDGGKFVGEWKNGKRHGAGALYSSGGSRYRSWWCGGEESKPPCPD